MLIFCVVFGYCQYSEVSDINATSILMVISVLLVNVPFFMMPHFIIQGNKLFIHVFIIFLCVSPMSGAEVPQSIQSLDYRLDDQGSNPFGCRGYSLLP
jgi:hypothetical protein